MDRDFDLKNLNRRELVADQSQSILTLTGSQACLEALRMLIGEALQSPKESEQAMLPDGLVVIVRHWPAE